MRTLLYAALLFLIVKGPHILSRVIEVNSVSRLFYPNADSIIGVDVSHYQKDIEWDQLKVKFVFIKATEGIDYIDPKFSINWSSAKSAGILRGAYHYFKPNKPADLQALNFIRSVRLEKGDLLPVLDVEEGIENSSIKDYVLTYCRILENSVQQKPIIYCNLNYYRSLFENDERFKDYPFWIAHYTTNSNNSGHIWQKTDRAKIPGIKTPVDLNIFQGDTLGSLIIN